MGIKWCVGRQRRLGRLEMRFLKQWFQQKWWKEAGEDKDRNNEELLVERPLLVQRPKQTDDNLRMVAKP